MHVLVLHVSLTNVKDKFILFVYIGGMGHWRQEEHTSIHFIYKAKADSSVVRRVKSYCTWRGFQLRG